MFSTPKLVAIWGWLTVSIRFAHSALLPRVF